MLGRSIVLALLVRSVCVAQVTGVFSLDKSTFAAGEPVFLNLTLSNQGDTPEEVVTSDPYTFCSQYHVQISRQGSPRTACFQSQGFGGSCLSGAVTLPPHGTRTERILLNYPNDSRGALNPPVRLPGDYTVDALRTISYAPLGPDSHVFQSASHTEVHQVFDVHVDGMRQADPASFAPFVQQLASPDGQVREEAARTLATLAPPALEPLLLTFATSDDTEVKSFAPLALANLASKKSLATLAELLVHTHSGSYESMSAGEYLGRTHDSQWFPLLLGVADRDGPMYLPYAAQSGGDAAIPALLTRMRSGDLNVRNSAIYALGNTKSRAVIPLLINLLRLSPGADAETSADEAIGANAALQQLTHRFVDQPRSDPSWVEAARQHWQQWWASSGQDAKTFWPGECVPDTPLP